MFIVYCTRLEKVGGATPATIAQAKNDIKRGTYPFLLHGNKVNRTIYSENFTG